MIKKLEDRMKARSITVYEPDWIKAAKKAKKQGTNLSTLIRRFISMWLNGDIDIKY